MTIYARAAVFIDQREGSTWGTYTIGKEYPICDERTRLNGPSFTIIDDVGDPIPCWWDGSDPEVIWERIER